MRFEPASDEQLAAFHGGAVGPDATHYDVAADYLARIEHASGQRPVYCLGALWRFDSADGLWHAVDVDAISADIGRSYQGIKLCRRGSDYRQIASLVSVIAADEDFFAGAPAGVAALDGFWRVTDAGVVERENLDARHRQRMRCQAEPDFDDDGSGMPLFSRLLDHALGIGEAGLAQRELLQMGLGAALARTLWRQRVAMLLYGATSTGKSTVLEIFRAFMPADLIGATSPQNWASEYYVAALAGKIVNMVGELDPHVPIPGGAFKAVTGGDVVEGRHPTHRPFSFVCTSGHIFNANRLPPTRDKSDAFFRRWRIVEFRNPIPVGQEMPGLAGRIVDEEAGAVLGWLLSGAAQLARLGILPETDDHRRLVEYWRAANNSALQYLLDPAYCQPESGHECSGTDVYDSYRRWARDCGLQPLGRNGFFEAVEEGAGRIGMRIYLHPTARVKYISGVSLLK